MIPHFCYFILVFTVSTTLQCRMCGKQISLLSTCQRPECHSCFPSFRQKKGSARISECTRCLFVFYLYSSDIAGNEKSPDSTWFQRIPLPERKWSSKNWRQVRVSLCSMIDDDWRSEWKAYVRCTQQFAVLYLFRMEHPNSTSKHR